MNVGPKSKGKNLMTPITKAGILAGLLLALVACDPSVPKLSSNAFIRDYVLKLNTLGGSLIHEEDPLFALIQKARGLGEEVDRGVKSLERARSRARDIEQEWLSMLNSLPDRRVPSQLFELALLAYLSHLKGGEILVADALKLWTTPEERNEAITTLREYGFAFGTRKEALLNETTDIDIKLEILELRKRLNHALLDVRYWPSRLTPSSDPFEADMNLSDHVDDYMAYHFDRIKHLKERIFNIKGAVDEQGKLYFQESIKNDFNLDFDRKWQTDLEMADLMIGHFLLIRNELEGIKERLLKDQQDFPMCEGLKASDILIYFTERLVLVFARQLLGDYKWVLTEEMKSQSEGTLHLKLSKEKNIYASSEHDRFLYYVKWYLNELSESDYSRLQFLEALESFGRLTQTIERYEEIDKARLTSSFPSTLLEKYPGWKSFYDLLSRL